jgi:hypothetical protein
MLEHLRFGKLRSTFSMCCYFDDFYLGHFVVLVVHDILKLLNLVTMVDVEDTVLVLVKTSVERHQWIFLVDVPDHKLPLILAHLYF